MTDRLYATKHIKAPNTFDLAAEMTEFFYINPGISIRDVTILAEQQFNQLSPTKTSMQFVALVTFKVAPGDNGD
ncbi:MAG: hypothetical protein KAI27_01735 [Rhodospirillaceae bacterium]|nr:hypothetical protein [Rhodospirillaceae bacterium]